MVGLIHNLLARQDPSEPHTLLTRVIICFCISFAYAVLYGLYGLFGSIALYLLGVELLGLSLHWMFYPLLIGILLGLWKAVTPIRNYWSDYGHGY